MVLGAVEVECGAAQSPPPIAASVLPASATPPNAVSNVVWKRRRAACFGYAFSHDVNVGHREPRIDVPNRAAQSRHHGVRCDARSYGYVQTVHRLALIDGAVDLRWWRILEVRMSNVRHNTDDRRPRPRRVAGVGSTNSEPPADGAGPRVVAIRKCLVHHENGRPSLHIRILDGPSLLDPRSHRVEVVRRNPPRVHHLVVLVGEAVQGEEAHCLRAAQRQRIHAAGRIDVGQRAHVAEQLPEEGTPVLRLAITVIQ